MTHKLSIILICIAWASESIYSLQSKVRFRSGASGINYIFYTPRDIVTCDCEYKCTERLCLTVSLWWMQSLRQPLNWFTAPNREWLRFAYTLNSIRLLTCNESSLVISEAGGFQINFHLDTSAECHSVLGQFRTFSSKSFACVVCNSVYTSIIGKCVWIFHRFQSSLVGEWKLCEIR